MEFTEKLRKVIQYMRENQGEKSPHISIDTTDKRILLIGEINDETHVLMDEFKEGVKIDDEDTTAYRRVMNVLIEQIDDYYNSGVFKDERCITILHVDNLEDDVIDGNDCINSLIYDMDLVVVILNNRACVYKDVNPVIERISELKAQS